MKRAIIYARVSDRKQFDEGISIDAQIEVCTAHAARLGASVVRVFRDEGISGRFTKQRTAFKAALAFCETGMVDYFVTWSTSRFARNAVDLWVQSDHIKSLGTRLECLNADIDDETDAGFINKMFHGAMDQMVSRQISRDTLRSMKKLAADGFFTGGRVPFGYRTELDGQRNRMLIHDEEAIVVQKAFGMALQGLGAQVIAKALNDAGQLKRGERWKKTTLNYMLKSEVYTGLKTFNRANKRTGKVKPRDQWIQVAAHPGLVTQVDFDKVQLMMEERTPPRPQGGAARSIFVFAGLMKCGICGGALQVVNGTSRAGTLYNYYGCCAHKKGAVRCLFRNVRADLFDDWLLGEVFARVVTVEAMTLAVRELTDLGSQWARDREAQRIELVRTLRDLEARRGKLFDLLEVKGLDTPDLADVRDRLQLRNAEIRATQARLERLEEAPAPKKAARIDPAIAVEVMKEVVMAGDAEKKRAFMGALLGSITVTVDKVLLEYKTEALVSLGHPNGVRNEVYWLPDLDSNQGPAD